MLQRLSCSERLKAGRGTDLFCTGRVREEAEPQVLARLSGCSDEALQGSFPEDSSLLSVQSWGVQLDGDSRGWLRRWLCFPGQGSICTTTLKRKDSMRNCRCSLLRHTIESLSRLLLCSQSFFNAYGFTNAGLSF